MMDNPYEKAQELIAAIQETKEYSELKKIKEEIAQDYNAYKMLTEIRERQLNFQLKQMKGEEVTVGERENLDHLFATIMLNPLLKQFFELEHKLNLLMNDVTKIIAQPFEDLYK